MFRTPPLPLGFETEQPAEYGLWQFAGSRSPGSAAAYDLPANAVAMARYAERVLFYRYGPQSARYRRPWWAKAIAWTIAIFYAVRR